MDDLMTFNNWRFKQHGPEVRFGSGYSPNERFSFSGWMLFKLYSLYDIARTHNRYSNYFDSLYNGKLDHYLKQDNFGGLGLNMVYNYRPLFDLEMSFFYSRNDTKLEFYRENWLFSVWFRLFVL
jgi:hypothetical protein